MGKHYGQIGIRERCEISRLQAEGYSIRQIAAALDRSPSSISREVRRNATRTKGYDPEEAQARARARMWSGSRLDRDDDLRESVLALLMRSRSPEQVSGHLRQEADLMLFRRHSQAVLALHERHTRLLIAVRLPGKGADHIASVMTQVLSAFPPTMRRSVTFDNGTEFARRHRLHDLGVRTFFCDTYSPWQKGGVENAIGNDGRGEGRWAVG